MLIAHGSDGKYLVRIISLATTDSVQEKGMIKRITNSFLVLVTLSIGVNAQPAPSPSPKEPKKEPAAVATEPVEEVGEGVTQTVSLR